MEQMVPGHVGDLADSGLQEDHLPVQGKDMVETGEGLMLVPQEEEVRTRLGTDGGNRTLF